MQKTLYILRIKNRVLKGGHNVPQKYIVKIKKYIFNYQMVL